MSKTTQVVNETNRRNAGSGLWEFENSSADSLWWNALQQAALPWLGTPYLWGGEGPDSVDCSAFVRAVFYKVNGDSLPRRAAWQYLQGFPVPMDCLRPGDLVFFGRPAIGVEHVGIYWGGGWFINATVSRGVAFSRLDESFWKERILGARRRYRL